MVGLLLASLLAQAGGPHEPVLVVVASKRPGADPYAQKVAAAVVRALAAEGTRDLLDPAAAAALLKRFRLDPRACQGATACLIKLAKAAGPRAVVVAVDVGKIGKSLAVHLEAAAADAVDPLAIADFTPGADRLATEMTGPVNAFVKELTARLHPAPVATPPPPAWNDSPKTTRLEPELSSPPLEVVSHHATAGGGSGPLPWVLAGGAVASLAVSGTFAVLGSQDKQAFEAAIVNGNSSLPASEFQAIQDRGNGRFTVALTSALVGAALGATSAILLATGD